MKKLTCSILIPVYNKQDYLEQCLESIRNQTMPDFEVILIDDCSTDNSLSIIEKYCLLDKRFKYYKNTENKKISYNRNLLIQLANAEYILFVDPDDYIKRDTLKNLLPYCDSQIDFIKYGVDYLNRPENCDQDKYNYISSSKVLSTDDAFGLFISDVRKRYAISCGYCVKKEIFTNFNIKYPEEIIVHEDVAVTPIVMAYSRNIGILNYNGYCYVENNKGISNSFYRKENQDLTTGKSTNKHKQFQTAAMYAINEIVKSPFISPSTKISIIEDLSIRGSFSLNDENIIKLKTKCV